MPRELFRSVLLRAWQGGRRLLLEEDGQQMAEYSAIVYWMMLSALGLFFFIPDSINAYKTYIRGFYFILGLPVP
ncbi:MAG: hypothetical protein ACOX6T_21800 [Myxococcales bacterium]|jgi:hypothetical protein